MQDIRESPEDEAARLGRGQGHTGAALHLPPLWQHQHHLDTTCVPLSGRGSDQAFSALRRASPPQTVADAEGAAGPCVLTNLVDMAEAAMRFGAQVTVVLRRTPEGRQAAKFTFDDTASSRIHRFDQGCATAWR